MEGASGGAIKVRGRLGGGRGARERAKGRRLLQGANQVRVAREVCTSAARMPLGVPLPGRAVPGEAGEAPERVVVTSRFAAAGAVSVVEASDWSAMLLPLAATKTTGYWV